MFCKKCYEDISGDCVLTSGICVFCYYKINEWDSNGQLIKKKDAITNYKDLFINYVKYYKELLRKMERALNEIPKGTPINKKRKLKKKISKVKCILSFFSKDFQRL